VKIAFWSNGYMKRDALLNFAAISIASVMRYPYTITILENYLDKDNLGKAFFTHFDKLDARYEGSGFYEGGGIEGLLRRIYRNDSYPSLLRGYLREVIPKHLYYIPQGGIINCELFDYELYHNINKLLGLLENNSDHCYINITQQNHLSSNAILQESDLIVINLFQNPNYLDNFFKNYYSLIPKALFIVGDYSPKSFMSCKRMARLYDIPLEDIIPIPYNENFHEACKYGAAKEFLNCNFFCNIENANYIFIQGIRKAVYMIFKRIIESSGTDKKDLINCGT
jgi:hypothetical protein